MKPIQIQPTSLLLGGALVAATALLTGMQSQATDELRELLEHTSIVFVDDGYGNQVKTIRFEGVNVQIVNDPKRRPASERGRQPDHRAQRRALR